MRRHPRSLALLVLFPLLALLAACGASGGEDADTVDGGTETTAAADGDGTTEPTDEGDDERIAVTSEELEAILPTEDDVPAGYTETETRVGDEDDESDDDADDESDPTDDAILEACPDAAILEELDNEDSNPDEVVREFENDVQATLEVALDPTPNNFTEDTIDQVVEALDDCGTIETSDPETGDIEMTITAERNDDYGDYGVELAMDATFSLFGAPVQIEFRGIIYSVDGLTVSVTASSGFDENTFEATPGDYDAIDDLAELMQERVGEL